MQPHIYLITNNINGKTYIGKTCGKAKYYFTGGIIIKKAIKKYGKNAFTKTILTQGDFNETLLNELEKHYIWLLSNPKSKSSYNVLLGGEGSPGLKHTQDTRKIIGKYSKINSNRQSHKDRVGSIKYWKDKKRSLETIKAIKDGNSKEVYQYTLEGVFIKKWDCMSDANRFYNLKSCGVQSASDPNNRKKTAAGYLWKRNIILT
jgi:group I intron endonuclease